MPAVDELILAQLILRLSMMRGVVVAEADTLQEAEAHVADSIAEHECADPCGVALKREGNHVEHQAAVFLVIARLLRGSRFVFQRHARFPVSLLAVGSALHSLLDRSHDGKVLVEPEAIGGPTSARRRLASPSTRSSRRVSSLAACRFWAVPARYSRSYTLRGFSSRARSVGIAPGNMRTVNPRVPHREVDAHRNRGNPEFQGGKRSPIAETLRGQLVHGSTVGEIDARSFLDGGASQDGGLFAVMPIAAIRACIPEVAQDQDVVVESGEGFECW